MSTNRYKQPHLAIKLMVNIIAAVLITVAMIHPLIPQHIESLTVYDNRPEDWIITNRYIKDIKSLPEFLKKDSTTIYIGRKGSYVEKNTVYLNVNNYHKDVVLHESIHVFDNQYKITDGSAYYQCLLKDHYRIDDSLSEVFVTTMMFQYKHPKRMKAAFPNTYQFQRDLIEKELKGV